MTKAIIKALLLTCMMASTSVAASSEESLYDAGNTVRMSGFPLLNFGPNASSFRYDKRMIRAAEIARQRAHSHSVRRCWSYVKSALLAADVVDSRPTTAYAKEAGAELLTKYGFKRIYITDPYKAPVGSVLVYGGRGAGHVEFRTESGFVSDFVSKTPSKRPLIGVYVKPKQG
jgi:hypothetical protein